MNLFTYDTPRPKPANFLRDPGTASDPLELPKPLPEEEPGAWGNPITADVSDDTERPRGDDSEDTPLEEDEPEIAVDEDEVPPARGPETEPP